MTGEHEEAPKASGRQSTQLEAAGAEFLVLGHLLIEGIHGFKSYRRFPGYDIMAVDASTPGNCRIQVNVALGHGLRSGVTSCSARDRRPRPQQRPRRRNL